MRALIKSAAVALALLFAAPALAQAPSQTQPNAANVIDAARTNATNVFTAAQTINLNSGSLPTPQSGTILQIGNANSTVTRIEADAFGAASHFSGLRAEGTAASPTALATGSEMTSFNAGGYNGSAWVVAKAGWRCYASPSGSTWTTSDEGTYCDVLVTPPGTLTSVEAAKFQAASAASVSATLGTQQTIAGQLILANVAAGAFATMVQSSASATAALSLTLPPAPPAGNGYAMVFTTSGIGSFENIGTGPFLPLAGGTMSGAIAMGGNNISGGGTYNGQTITSGAGTLTLNNNILAIAGTSDAITQSYSGTTNVTFPSGTYTLATTATTVASLGNYSADSTLTITGTGSGPWTGAVTIKCTVATSSQVGCVEPDGTIITDTAGAITVAKAGTSAFGVVEIGSGGTIAAASGVITVATATSAQLGASSPDNTTIKATSGVYAAQYPTSGDLMLSAGNGAVPTAYAGTSSAGSVLTALSAAGGGSFLAYTNANTASTLVERDSSGNFSAGTITASLTGTASAAPLSGITGLGTGVATALGDGIDTNGGVLTGATASIAAGALHVGAGSGSATGGVADVATGALLASGGAGTAPAYCTACTLTTSLTIGSLALYGTTTGNGPSIGINGSILSIEEGTGGLSINNSAVTASDIFISNGVYIGNGSTTEGAGTINAANGYYAGNTKGVTCSGALTAIASITIKDGIITGATGTGGTCS